MTTGVRSRLLPPHIQQPSFVRRHWLLVGGAVVVAALRLMPVPPQPVATPHSVENDFARFHDQVVRVVNVVDGDTFDFEPPDGVGKSVRVRLWGVDTPEVAGPRTELMHWGTEASSFAKQTLGGELVRLELLPERTRDRYDRLLVYAFVEGGVVSFNHDLVKRGHAYADTRFAHPMLEAFRLSEDAARESSIGLWKDITPQQMPRWRR